MAFVGSRIEPGAALHESLVAIVNQGLGERTDHETSHELVEEVNKAISSCLCGFGLNLRRFAAKLNGGAREK
jgi:hypothetical protein